MSISIDHGYIFKLLRHRLANLFLFESEEQLRVAYNIGITKAIECFKKINLKYFCVNDNLFVNPHNSGQFTMILYFVARAAWEADMVSLAEKLFCLNKMLHAIDLFYEVKMPSVFLLEHPVGSVVGRGTYGEYLVIQQNCTVGSDFRGLYPRFGNYVWMFTGSAVIGDSVIGNNVFLSAGSIVINQSVPDNTIVFGRSPNLVLKKKEVEYFRRNFPFIY